MLAKSFELTIRELCEEILSEPRPERLPAKITSHVQRTFPVEWSTLWVTEQVGTSGEKRLRLAAAEGAARRLMTAEKGGPAWYRFDEGLTGYIAKTRTTVNIAKPEDFDRYPHAKKYDKVMYGVESAGGLCRCVLGVPLLLKSPPANEWRVIGVLKMENMRPTPGHDEEYFTDADARIVEGYAAVVAVALEKAQMRADSLRVGQGLLEISKDLLANLGDKPPDLDHIVQQTADVISAQVCALWLRGGTHLFLKAAAGYPGGSEGAVPYDLEVPGHDYSGVGLTVFVANTKLPLNLGTAEEVQGHPAWKGANDRTMWKVEDGAPCYSLVAIPLIEEDTKDLKGVFKIENKTPTIFQLESYFNKEDEKLLTTLGNTISLSLVVSERFERLHRLENLIGNIRVLDGLEMALFFVLTGLTHGRGLEYNRALIFLKQDPGSSKLVCKFAVGHLDDRAWDEEMRTTARPDKIDLDALCREFEVDQRRFVDTPIMKAWYGTEVSLDDLENQKIAFQACARRSAEKYLSSDVAPQDVLHGLPHGDFVLIPIHIDKELRGIIYADNRFTGNRINKYEIHVLDLFSGMAGAIIQASEVPDRLRKENERAWRNFSQPAAHRLGTETQVIDGEIYHFCKPSLAELQDLVGLQHPAVLKIGESFGHIRSSVRRLRQAAKDYRALTPEPETPGEFKLKDLLEHAIDRVDLRDLEVSMQFSDESLTITGRRQRLSYVFEELLTNSWKESPAAAEYQNAGRDEPVKVKIIVTEEEQAVQCIVADTGPGIQEPLRKSLFTAPQKGRHGGTGLGLLIIRRILSDNGGTIDLISAGKPQTYSGACFRITLPRDVTASGHRTGDNAAVWLNERC
jgi:signal transduction histidine kinase